MTHENIVKQTFGITNIMNMDEGTFDKRRPQSIFGISFHYKRGCLNTFSLLTLSIDFSYRGYFIFLSTPTVKILNLHSPLLIKRFNLALLKRLRNKSRQNVKKG